MNYRWVGFFFGVAISRRLFWLKPRVANCACVSTLRSNIALGNNAPEVQTHPESKWRRRESGDLGAPGFLGLEMSRWGLVPGALAVLGLANSLLALLVAGAVWGPRNVAHQNPHTPLCRWASPRRASSVAASSTTASSTAPPSSPVRPWHLLVAHHRWRPLLQRASSTAPPSSPCSPV